MEPDLQIRLIEQFTVCREIVIGNSGFYGIFHFGSPAETTIGVFTENDWSAGDRKQRFSLTGFKLSKDEMKECGRTTVTVSREEDKMTEESIDALCNQAEKCGFGFIAISWKNEWRAKGTISRPLMTFFVNLTWSSIKNGQMLDNADGTLNGTPIEGWHVNVFRR
jgi:hypothetical protein